MKCLILVTLLAVGSQSFFTAEQHEFAKKLAITCSDEIGEGLPENIGDRFRSGDLTLTDAKSKCFMKCMFSKVGFIDGDGIVNKTVLVDKLSKGNPKEKAESFAERCNMFEGSDGCEKALGLYECYHKNKASYF
ncbi:general odorant-binding protein 56d-like [Topomyia yanbarensis]|uniref:general odorant-binding protein 56d-like n=1 Tax=Topomyia yanbarensis TaxID=2498891 RepID=UPI00273B4654|nr:general odorant-binding protein 56d-like [Topomyia yanbarensis]